MEEKDRCYSFILSRTPTRQLVTAGIPVCQTHKDCIYDDDEKSGNYVLCSTPLLDDDWQPLHYFDGRFGVVVGILAYYARDCGFDSFTVQKFVCMNMSVWIGVSMYNMYVFTKNIYNKYVFIRYLESVTQVLNVLTLD
jgi:hypothetical protein